MFLVENENGCSLYRSASVRKTNGCCCCSCKLPFPPPAPTLALSGFGANGKRREEKGGGGVLKRRRRNGGGRGPIGPPKSQSLKNPPAPCRSLPSLLFFPLKSQSRKLENSSYATGKVQRREFGFPLSSADVETIRGMMVRLRLFSVCLRNAERKVSACSEGGRVN